MTSSYRLVQWNRHKKVYDLCVLSGATALIGGFIAATLTLASPPDEMVMLIRASGIAAISMLTVILAIGPLHRLDARFAALLYNRRHFGVATFLVALMHAALVLLYYGGFGRELPFTAVLAYPTSAWTTGGFPFELLGLLALLILFVLASTSHDFWLKNLSPVVWKALHMLVYAAWSLALLHIALGALQSELNPLYPALAGAALVVVSALHIAAGLKSRGRPAESAEWIDAGSAADIPDGRAVTVRTSAGPVAIFRDRDSVSAIASVCAHQGGPLGEGKVVDGCVTCPWHGYQYNAASGQSPPPFTERVPTYRVRIEAGRVLLDPNPNEPGTPVEPARLTIEREVSS